VVAAACTGPVADTASSPGSQVPTAPPADTRHEDSPIREADTAPPTGSAPGLPPADTALPPLALTELARLDAPIDTTVLADRTVLVAERAGIVRVMLAADGATPPAGTPGRVLIDVTQRTTTDGERGLLAIAVAPGGRELFVSMTDRDGDTLIEAYPLSGGRITGAPRAIYALPQPRAKHNGGAILFAPDGMLLVALGDGGGAGDPEGAGQDLSTPLGAVLRLDVNGATTVAPADNPFVDRDGAAPEIAAYGLRNPWRMSLDAPRGELWIADVGQSSREEINRVALDAFLGANLGWALREGSERFLGEEPRDHVAPLYEYEHGPGCSVSGGHVYRGSALPGLIGGYVFSDYCDGEIRALFDGGDGTVVSRGLGVTGDRVVGFGVDADGELLVLELGGRVLRLSPL
jgi:glucose/arabinose dehydrogenase